MKRLLSFRRYFPQYGKTPDGALTIEAGEFLTQLKKEGNVPGFAKDDRGMMTYVDGFEGCEYPVSRTFHVQKKGEGSDYHYTLVKGSPSSHWKLEMAWRSDGKGNVVEEYTVPV